MKRLTAAMFIGALVVLLAACGSTQLQGDISSQSLSGLGDFVWHDLNRNGIQDPGEQGVDGVIVKLFNCDGVQLALDGNPAEGPTGQVIQAIKFGTIGNGNYSFTELLSPQVVAENLDSVDMFGNDVPCYRVQVILPAGYIFSPQDQGGDDAKDSDVDPGTGFTADIVLPKAATDFTWDAGIHMDTQTGGEGCTPGYWRQDQHFDSWVGYAPGDSFDAVFGVTSSDGDTLLQAVWSRGGGEQAMQRHAVAALLNAASSVDYLFTQAEIIALVQNAYASGEFEAAKNLLAIQNEEGCPLN